nr:unnamed protein product [Leishmania braziliensis]
MGNCCGSVSDNGIASTSPRPSPPRRRRWPGLTGSATGSEKTMRKQRNGLKFTPLAVTNMPFFMSRGKASSKPIHGTAVVTALPTASLMDGDAATLATPIHKQGVHVITTTPHGASAGGFDLLMPDLFSVSASSFSALLESFDMGNHSEGSISTCRDEEGQSSLVEVSQPTQSLRGNTHMHSDMDMTSEWELLSFDRTGRRSERWGCSGLDHSRLHQLIIREAEVRASLTVVYMNLHQQLLLHLTKERLIAVHLGMLQRYQSEWTVQCMCWIMALESVVREGVAREWWAERAVLVRRVGSSRVSPSPSSLTRDDAMPGTADSHVVKRQDSLPHVLNLYTTADLTPSEGAAEDDTWSMRSQSMRAFSSPAPSALHQQQQQQQQQLSALSGSRSASAELTAGLHSVPRVSARRASSSVSSSASGLRSPLLTRSVTAAQQAQRYRIVRGPQLPVGEGHPRALGACVCVPEADA